MKNFHRLAGPLLVLAALAAAFWLLGRELRDFHLRDLDEGLRQISPASMALAVGLTALNFVVLLGYDMLAVHQLRFPVPWRKVALAAFLGDVCAENFGSLLGGSSIRYRLYSAWGLSAVQVMRLVLILSLTFWVGAIALGGTVFVLHPLAVPPRLHLPMANTFPVGVVLLALAALYLLLCAPKHRRLRVLGWTVPLPTLPVALGQIAVTSADILVATGVLYAILPPGLGVSFGQLLGVYLLAMLAGACSHVPGGLGVFELVMVVMLAPDEPHGLVAALLLFRGVYYLLPLLVAAVVLGIHEGMRRRETLGRLASTTGQAAPLVVPRLLALVLFAAGTVLLVTGTLPAGASSLGWLNRLVPLALLELSHFTASIVGVLLLLLARAVARRLDSAYWLSLALLSAGALLALVRGVDIVEACVLALAALAMLPCRKYFHRRGSLWRQPLGADVLAAIGLVLLGAVGLGLFAHKHVEYSGELWRQFELQGDAPRFLRAMAGAAAVLLVAGVVRLLKPERIVRRATEPDDLQQA